MKITGEYAYWRSVCQPIREHIRDRHRYDWITVEEWKKRDISDHHLIVNHEEIWNYALGFAEGYAERDFFSEAKSIILSTCVLDDLEYQKLKRHMELSNDELFSKFLIATMVRFIFMNHYMPERKNKRLAIGI